MSCDIYRTSSCDLRLQVVMRSRQCTRMLSANGTRMLSCIVSSIIMDLRFFQIIVNISSFFFIVINYFLLLLCMPCHQQQHQHQLPYQETFISSASTRISPAPAPGDLQHLTANTRSSDIQQPKHTRLMSAHF